MVIGLTILCGISGQLVSGEKKIRPSSGADVGTLGHHRAFIKLQISRRLPGTRDRLQRAAEAAFKLDTEMSEIREEIQEAQQYTPKHESDVDGTPHQNKED